MTRRSEYDIDLTGTIRQEGWDGQTTFDPEG